MYQILNIKVRPIMEADKFAFPHISKPVVKGYFSVSPDGDFERGEERKRYLVDPSTVPLPLTLNGPPHDVFRLKADPNELFLDNLLYFIKTQQQAFFFRNEVGAIQLNADFVCTREVISLMMCAPYQKIRNWTLAASYYKNTMYICEIDSEDRTNGLHLDQAHLDIAINNSWLEKLKQYCLSESNNRMPDPSQPLEKHGTFNCVFSTTISGIKMIFEAPMIVENSQNRCDAESNFVELKVRPTTMSQLEWSEYYLNVATKWWADCYLVGIDDLFIATCDKNGRIVHIKRTKSREIYKESEKYWSTAVCANFMARLLSTIKCTMIHLNSASTVYIYDFNAMNAQITYKVYEGRNRYTFIPDWYRMMLDNLENSMH